MGTTAPNDDRKWVDGQQARDDAPRAPMYILFLSFFYYTSTNGIFTSYGTTRTMNADPKRVTHPSRQLNDVVWVTVSYFHVYFVYYKLYYLIQVRLLYSDITGWRPTCAPDDLQ